MGDWQGILAEATENLLKDPVAGADAPADNWTITNSGGTGTVNKTSSDALFGNTSFEFAMGSSTVVDLYQAVTCSATTYTLSIYIKAAIGDIRVRFNTTITADPTTIVFLRNGWYLYTFTGAVTAGSREFGVRVIGGATGVLLGGIQLEEKAYPTTLAYGSRKGNITKGYYWTGIPHYSTSIRDAQERSGGRILVLSDYMNVQKVSGWGVPNQTISRDKPAQLDGTIYNKALYDERTLQFTGIIIPDTADEKAFNKRAILVDLMRRDLVVPEQPWILRYTGGDSTLQTEVFYEGGLDGLFDAQSGNNDKVSFRLFANDPVWYAIGNDATTLDVQDTLTTNYLIQRSREGLWANLATTLDGPVRALAKDNIGNLFLGGDMSAPGAYAVEWDGSSLAALDAGPGGAIHSMLWDSLLYAAGENNTIESWDTSAWATLQLSSKANGPIYAVWTDNTTVWVGGDFTQIGGIAANNIAALTIASGVWAAVGTGTNGPVYTLRVVGTNLFVGGAFTLAGGVASTNKIARRDLSGGTWNAMGTGVTGTGVVYAIDADGSNNVYPVGDFTEMGGVAFTGKIAMWNGSVWAAVGSGFGIRGTIYAIEIDGTDIYIGGTGLYLTTSPQNLLVWGGASWGLLTGGDTNGPVYALYHDGSDLYIGGGFTKAGAVASTARIASHNGSAYSALDSGIGNGIVYSITPRGTSRIIGGSFINADGQANGDYVIEWDGANFVVMATGLTGIVRAMATDTATSDIYIGGLFNGGAEGNYLTLWDDVSFTEQASGSANLSTNATIRAIAKLGNIIYFGGDFTTVNSVATNYVHALDVVTTLPYSVSSGTNGPVNALLADTSGFIYLGGNFTTAGGVTVNYVAKYNPATNVFTALGSGLSGPVRALAIDPRTGYLWACGDNGLLAYWNGSVWTVIDDTGTTAVLYALAFDDDGNLFIGGAFTEIGGQIADGAVQYGGNAYTLLDIDLPEAATVYAIFNDDNELTFGFNTAGLSTTPGTSTVTNNGKALSFPIIEFTGPGVLRRISNTTIKKNIYFNNLELGDGEIVTLDLSPFAKTLVSNSRGDISGKIVQSDEDTFALRAGANTIRTFVTDPTATALISWRLAYEDLSGPSA
jgi:hypothetical protein